MTSLARLYLRTNVKGKLLKRTFDLLLCSISTFDLLVCSIMIHLHHCVFRFSRRYKKSVYYILLLGKAKSRRHYCCCSYGSRAGPVFVRSFVRFSLLAGSIINQSINERTKTYGPDNNNIIWYGTIPYDTIQSTTTNHNTRHAFVHENPESGRQNLGRKFR